MQILFTSVLRLGVAVGGEGNSNRTEGVGGDATTSPFVSELTISTKNK